MTVRSTIISILLLTVVCLGGLHAQSSFWRQLDGPYGGDAYYFITAPNGELFTGTEGTGMYRSSDEGATWRMFGPEGGGGYPVLVTKQGAIFATSNGDGAIFRSTDGGQVWAQTAEGALNVRPGFMTQLANDDILMASRSGIYRSTNNGARWSFVALDSIYIRFFSIAPDGAVFAASNDSGLYRSTDDGVSWMSVGTMQKHPVDAIVFLGAGELIVGADDGVYRSVDNGDSFTPFALMGKGIGPFALKRLPGGDFLACAGTDGLVRIAPDGSITKLNAPPGDLFGLALTSSGAIVLGYNGKGVVRSTDNGATFYSTGMPHAFEVSVMAEAWDGAIYVAGQGGLYRTRDLGASWSDLGLPQTRPDQIALGSSGTVFVTGGNTDIYRTTNEGASWELIDPKISVGYGFTGAYVTRSGAVVISSNYGIIRSTDNGDTWASVISGEDGGELTMSPNGDLWSIGFRTLRHSTDDGLTWDRRDPPIPSAQGYEPDYIAAPGNGVLVLSGVDLNGPKMAYSTDNGATWDTTSTGCDDTFGDVRLVAGSFGYVYAVSSCGVYRSGDNGATWQVSAPLPPDETKRAFLVDRDGNYWYGGVHGVYYSAHLGNSVAEDAATLSASLRAFPNPTRGDATISFSLQRREHVHLSLCNLLGQTVATIADETMGPGEHSVSLQAGQPIDDGASSDAFIIRLRVGDRVESTCLHLVR